MIPMGRLSPGTPERGGGHPHIMQPTPPAPKPDGSHEAIGSAMQYGCDRCGRSGVEGSRHTFVTIARHEIVVSPELSVFLCDHHFRQHELHLIASKYETRGA